MDRLSNTQIHSWIRHAIFNTKHIKKSIFARCKLKLKKLCLQLFAKRRLKHKWLLNALFFSFVKLHCVGFLSLLKIFKRVEKVTVWMLTPTASIGVS